jgi:hypothetical protein
MNRSPYFTGIIVLIFLSLLIVVPVSAQAGGFTVTCNDGTSFSNGVEVRINQMRTGFNYTATAIGLNGFDPVLAVLNTNSSSGLCDDDDATAAQYSANLPSTGPVSASGTSARVTFSNNGSNAFEDISLVVGGYGNSSGRFLLVLEGMAVTAQDGTGDPFSVNLTPEMVASGVPLTLYMISVTNDLDPLIYLVDSSGNSVNDNSGKPIACDDGGDTTTCFGQSQALSSSFVTFQNGSTLQNLPGGPHDAMLNLPLAGMSLSNDRSNNFFNFLMTSYQKSTLGQYVMVFDIGIGAAANGTGGKPPIQGQATPTPQPPQQQGNQGGGAAGGLNVTCNGGSNITNGIEVRVDQMRTGFNYTATAVGVNGFDPVLAVLPAGGGSGLCSDNDSTAASYSANLPTAGAVSSSANSARVPFSNTGSSAFEDISLVVGGKNGMTGEVMLILEGMAVTSADNLGDEFSVNITPGMVSSGVPLTVYMISTTNNLDPLINLVDANLNTLTDNSNAQIACDDAGDSAHCWGQSASLSNSFVTFQNGSQLANLPGGQYDAMLSLDLTGMSLNSDPSQNFFNFLMTSYQKQTLGQYVMVFDIGVGGGAGGGLNGGSTGGTGGKT